MDLAAHGGSDLHAFNDSRSHGGLSLLSSFIALPLQNALEISRNVGFVRQTSFSVEIGWTTVRMENRVD